MEVCSGYRVTWGFAKIRGTHLGGPHTKDYSILGSLFVELPYRLCGVIYTLNAGVIWGHMQHCSTVGSVSTQKRCFPESQTCSPRPLEGSRK